MTETIYLPAMRDDGETEVMVEFTIYSWGSAPNTYGPPESCDPSDPIEASITDAWLAGADEAKVTLTEAEIERIEAKFYADPPEPDYEDFDD